MNLKRNVIFAIVIVFAVLAGSLAQTQTQTQAAHTSLSPVQFLHGTFPNQNLPEDGSTVTLVHLPFTVSAPTQMQVTSLIDVQFGGGACCGSGGPVVTEQCTLVLDGAPLLTTRWATNATLPASLSLTTTQSGIAAGVHTLEVQCTGSTDTGLAGEVALARSGGTSVILVSQIG